MFLLNMDDILFILNFLFPDKKVNYVYDKN